MLAARFLIRPTIRPIIAKSVPRFSSTLVSKLKEEAKFELENQEETDWIQEFENKGIWKIEEKPGSKEVSLVRQFENEKISAIFSTDSLVEAEHDMEEVQDEQDTPIQVAIIIEKGQGPALEIDASAQGDSFYIDNVAYVESAELARDETAQGDWIRRGSYGGPVFNDLDEGLVESFHKYIETRGFNQELAEFMSDYIVHKEQKEYVSWLEKVGKFIKA